MGGGGVNFHEFCKNETPHNPRLPWFTWFAGYYVSSWFAQCAPKRIAAAGSYVKKKKVIFMKIDRIYYIQVYLSGNKISFETFFKSRKMISSL